MSDETVQVLAAIGAAEAEHLDTSTDDLLLQVTSEEAHCIPPVKLRADKKLEFMDRWIAPEESHPHMLQHRYEERVAMVAARLCAPCAIKTECLALAARLPGYYNGWIRGGLTPAQRALTLDDLIETAGEGR
ncbi:hypothetical protein [Glycomyces artemisiae]|uniref:4Fe-4S Wbl-type domain-containing protein n=1 Tax=Glycomyces artemisiae TaxID=1076443 RepID=A0A2T0U6H3_9ACTN|nr:hypothetical protein [Glycomyces artemisiae]PRY53523.1 hypothetical protein B0I28_11722 [Glycomyces artemisiae]